MVNAHTKREDLIKECVVEAAGGSITSKRKHKERSRRYQGHYASQETTNYGNYIQCITMLHELIMA